MTIKDRPCRKATSSAISAAIAAEMIEANDFILTSAGRGE
jgi:hypothetical protein